MKDERRKDIDIRDRAKKAGIEISVDIDGILLEELTPAPFLASLGVSLETRIDNLLGMVKASLDAQNGFSGAEERYLPFMAVKGPFVREEYVPVIARIIREEGGHPAITLTKANDE